MDRAMKREVLHQIKKKYYGKGLKYLDWMGYPITNDNNPSYHHIVKAEDLRAEGKSDEATVENGAYLGKISHEKLHVIEMLDQELYDCWNDLFLMINRMSMYPIEDVWKMIFLLQEKTEKLLEEYTLSKQGIKISKKLK